MLGVAVLAVVALARAASPAPTVAVLTEARQGSGEVLVRRAGTPDWTPPEPLVALQVGDQIRVTGDGRAVLVFTGGDVQTVLPANSPYAVTAPRSQSTGDAVRALTGGIVQFLLGQRKEVTFESLSVRGPSLAPRIVSPRETRLLPGPVVLEWTGPPALRYRVQVLGPQGLVWQESDLPLGPVEYPASALKLQPGARYTWVLEAPGQPAQRAQFEIVPAADARALEAALADLQQATLTGDLPGTMAVMRGGFLLQEGLVADARREILLGLSREPRNPTLHLLLGYVYQRGGLIDLAAQQFDEAHRP